MAFILPLLNAALLEAWKSLHWVQYMVVMVASGNDLTRLGTGRISVMDARLGLRRAVCSDPDLLSDVLAEASDEDTRVLKLRMPYAALPRELGLALLESPGAVLAVLRRELVSLAKDLCGNACNVTRAFLEVETLPIVERFKALRDYIHFHSKIGTLVAIRCLIVTTRVIHTFERQASCHSCRAAFVVVANTAKDKRALCPSCGEDKNCWVDTVSRHITRRELFVEEMPEEVYREKSRRFSNTVCISTPYDFGFSYGDCVEITGIAKKRRVVEPFSGVTVIDVQLDAISVVLIEAPPPRRRRPIEVKKLPKQEPASLSGTATEEECMKDD
jgi:hypothetical protein